MGNSSVKLNEGETLLDPSDNGRKGQWSKRDDLEPSPGDIIQVKRGSIVHALLFVGGGDNLLSSYVLHFYALNSDRTKKTTGKAILDYLAETNVFANLATGFRDADQPGAIALETVDSALGPGDECIVDNMEDHARFYGSRKRRTDEAIIREAQRIYKDRKDSPPMYNLVRFNCETFALKIRYGQDSDIPSMQTHLNNRSGGFSSFPLGGPGLSDVHWKRPGPQHKL